MVNLSDIKTLQASKAWKHFCFLSENQLGYDCAEPLILRLDFTDMDVLNTPPFSAIFFSGAGNYLGVNLITAIDCEPHVLGDLLKISCMGGEQYIIVAQ